MAIFIAESGHSTPDIVISVYLIVCCLISTSLNPVVFLYNYRRPNTTQRVVYRTLSLLDFTLCLLAPIMTVQNALKPTECGGQNLEAKLLNCYRRPATTIEKSLFRSNISMSVSTHNPNSCVDYCPTVSHQIPTERSTTQADSITSPGVVWTTDLFQCYSSI